MIGHRGKDASALQRSITEKLREVMFTKNRIILSTSSGTGLMEGAIRSCTAKRAIVFSVGSFGDRWAELAKLNGIEVDIHKEVGGEPTMPETVDQYLKTGKYDVVTITHNETSSGIMNPIEGIAAVVRKYPDVVWLLDCVSSLGGAKVEVDRLGIDICISSSQKCFALPPGLALASVSDKAIERVNKIGSRGYYFDFKSLIDFIDKKDHQYPSTPSLSHMFAMDFQLDRILKEGVENRFLRHMEMAEFMIEWATKHFAMYPKGGFESMTLCVIKNTRGISVADLNSELGKRHNIQIANGYGDMKEKTFRIAHMGELNFKDMEEVTGAIEGILGL